MEPADRFDIVGVGLAGWDVSLLVPRFPYDDRTHALQRSEQGGGMVANTLVTVARLGFSTTLAASVGDDPTGRSILADLAGHGVDTTPVVVQPGRSSPLAYCLAEEATGRKMIIGVPATAAALTSNTVAPQFWSCIERARVLHVDGWHPEVTLAAMDRAAAAGVFISYDAGHVPPEADQMLAHSDLVIASEVFVREFFGHEPDDELLCRMQALGPDAVAVTLGERGVIARAGGTTVRLGVFSVGAVDTTGAGDAFHGGFLAAHLKGYDFGACLRLASAVGAMCCRALSARQGLPDSWAAIERFINRTPYVSAP